MAKQLIISRDKEIRFLKGFLGKGCPLSSTLFIYGPAGSGKTHTIRTYIHSIEDSLNSDDGPARFYTLYVNCVEACGSGRILFEIILEQFIDKMGWRSPKRHTLPRCENAGDFVNGLRDLMSEWAEVLKTDGSSEKSGPTLMIVLDHADRLRDLDFSVLACLVRLEELAGPPQGRGWSLGIILISQSPWEKYAVGTFQHVPTILHFPNYSRDQLAEILRMGCPGGCDATVRARYAAFVNIVLTVCLPVCRNISELIYLAQVNWPLFDEPIREGHVKADDEYALWRAFQPQLKRSLATIYLREAAVQPAHDEEDKEEEDTENVPPEDEENTLACEDYKRSKHWMELPLFTRYLLIAAYLASYNPKWADKKFFVKNTGRVSSRAKQCAKKAEKTKNHLLGPKPFALDRLMAIFYALSDDTVTHTAHLASQVTSLVSLHMLAQCGGNDDSLGNPKFKCLISLDTVKVVALSVDFDIMRYLTDFA